MRSSINLLGRIRKQGAIIGSLFVLINQVILFSLRQILLEKWHPYPGVLCISLIHPRCWNYWYQQMRAEHYAPQNSYAYTDKKVFRTFRVDRMEAITQPQPEAREGEKEFKASQITSHEYKVFQMYHGEPMKVRVRFSNHLVDVICWLIIDTKASCIL